MRTRVGLSLTNEGIRWVLAGSAGRGATRVIRHGFVERSAGEPDSYLFARLRGELRAGTCKVWMIDDVQPPVLRVVQLPPMPEREAILALNQEAQTEVEILGGEVAHAAVRLESAGNQIRSLLAIMPRERIAELSRAMGSCGLVLSGIAAAPVLLMDLLRDMSLLDAKQSLAMVELGSTKANLAVARGGRMALLRQMQQGLDSSFLTGTDGHGIAAAVDARPPAGPDPDGHHSPKLTLVTNETDGLDLLERMDRGLEDLVELVSQIRRSLQIGNARGEAGPVSRLILAGSAARARPLASLLQNDLRIPVEVLDPRRWKRLRRVADLEDGDAPSFALPLALAALPLGSHGIMLGAEGGWRGAGSTLPRAAAVACLALDAALALTALGTARETAWMREAIDLRNSGDASSPGGAAEWAADRLDTLAGGLDPLPILDRMIECRPASVRFVGLRMRGDRVRWSVEADALAGGPDPVARQGAMNTFVEGLRCAFPSVQLAPLEDETGPRTRLDATPFSLSLRSEAVSAIEGDQGTAEEDE